MGKGSESTFLIRRYTNGQQIYNKPLNITNSQENANQNHETLLHTYQNGHYHKTKDNKYWCRCGEKSALVHCKWECKLVQSLQKVRLVLWDQLV